MEMTRREFVAVAGGCATLGLKGFSLGVAEGEREAGRTVTVCIYGATPGGLAAAISAASHGSTVVVVEPSGQIGGLLTSGLSWSDFRTFESLSGVFRDFTHRVEEHYIERYGAGSDQVTACFRGTHGEPHVNKQVLEEMLSEHDGIRVVLQQTLADVEESDQSSLRRIERLIFRQSAGGSTLNIKANMYIRTETPPPAAALSKNTATTTRGCCTLSRMMIRCRRRFSNKRATGDFARTNSPRTIICLRSSTFAKPGG